MPEHRLLVIDDDRLFLEIARHNLEQSGYAVEVTSDPREGFNRAIESHFDLILLDLMMPGLRGEEVLSLLKPLGGQRIVVISGHSGAAHRSRARDLGAVGYLEKPVSADRLCQTVREVLDSSVPADGGQPVGTPAGFSDRLAIWVFGEGPVTPVKRLVAAGVVAGLGGILSWLVWG